MPTRSCPVVATFLGLVLAWTAPALAEPSATTPARGLVVARYGFDGRSAAILDESGHGNTMHLVARNGGKLRSVTPGSGRALQFPAKCTARDACPHAVLQSQSTPELNPGDRPIAFGATVRLS